MRCLNVALLLFQLCGVCHALVPHPRARRAFARLSQLASTQPDTMIADQQWELFRDHHVGAWQGFWEVSLRHPIYSISINTHAPLRPRTP